MKKFIKDITEVGKDIWYGFVRLVEAACEAGEIIADKLTRNNKNTVVEVRIATDEIKKNVVWEDLNDY